MRGYVLGGKRKGGLCFEDGGCDEVRVIGGRRVENGRAYVGSSDCLGLFFNKAVG